MVRVIGTLDGRYAGASRRRGRDVGRGETQPVDPHRRLVAQHQIGADAEERRLPVQLGGGAPGPAG